MLWSVANQVTKVHGFNGGTLSDQGKIVMKNAYNEKGESSLTTARILELWNYRKHGNPHTRQQVASALQTLKEQGFVTTVGTAPRSDGSPGKPGSLYALVSVIERLTDPSVGAVEIKEPEIKSDIEIGDGNITTTKTDPSVGLVLTKLVEMNEQLNRHFTAVGESLEIGDAGNTQMRESYNKLVTKLYEAITKWSEIHDHNQTANNNNAEQFRIFVDNTNKNFLEIEDYLKHFTQTLNLKTDASNSNFDNRYYEQQITQAYRDGYKEGFKDGRKDYKEELTTQSVPKPREIH